MRKSNYKHTVSDNSKDRSRTPEVQDNRSNPRLADKFRQSLIGTMLFCGLTVGTCAIADAVFSNHQITVLDKNIFGDYNSIYDTACIEVDTTGNINNNIVLKAENIRLYNKNYYRDILNNTNNNSYNRHSFTGIIIGPDSMPQKPVVLIMQEKTDTIGSNTIINNNNKHHKPGNKKQAKQNSKSKSPFVEHGIASHMGHAIQGHRQASGERYNKNEMICAHKSLPFGTRIRVTDKKTGKSVIVRVTDRGPFGPGRVVDLSLAAARKLGIEKSGIAKVKIEKIL